ncbi:CAP domain-containing protein [Streptomonospora salina]|uniref:Uncharacterized protein YkwD n=1 Tax=Streptomonospora salina TaxID=104205 RepID=A0A841E3Y2_9ACTN|nr:CAP domain-containing protein [Streptomonospora salina]MBB5997144.1 uncharacterized protein YkwD [Streptomonospora salina]
MLLAAAGPPSANPLTPGSQSDSGSSPGADDALPPAADDFFDTPQSGPPADGGQGAGDGGGGAQPGDPPEAPEAPDPVVEDDTTVGPSPASEEDAPDEEGAEAGDGGQNDGSGGASAGSSGDGAQVSALAREVVELADEERAAVGCDPLRTDPELTEASKAHTRDMAERDYMAHESPEGKGPAERAQEAGYDSWSGENVAAGHTSAASVMEGWMDSPGHRKNILDCDNTEVGVAETDTKWAQNFGTG